MMYRGDSQQLCPFILTSFPFFFFISCDLFSFSTLSQWTCTDVGKRGEKKNNDIHTHTHTRTNSKKNRSESKQKQKLWNTGAANSEHCTERHSFFFFHHNETVARRFLDNCCLQCGEREFRLWCSCSGAPVCVCVCDIRYRVTTLSRGMQHVLKQAMRLHNTVPTF